MIKINRDFLPIRDTAQEIDAFEKQLDNLNVVNITKPWHDETNLSVFPPAAQHPANWSLSSLLRTIQKAHDNRSDYFTVAGHQARVVIAAKRALS